MDKIVQAVGVGLARIIGKHVLTGTGGSTDISGIVQALGSPAVTNGSAGKLSLTDINNIYFSVNKFYRGQPKASWLFTDGAYKFLRNASDGQNRPLLSVEGDQEMLLGKPVYICPSLATAYSSLGTNSVIFGDCSHIVIHTSKPQIQRHVELSQSGIEKGEALFVGRCRADASLFDPSAGNYPPLVLAAIS